MAKFSNIFTRITDRCYGGGFSRSFCWCLKNCTKKKDKIFSRTQLSRIHTKCYKQTKAILLFFLVETNLAMHLPSLETNFAFAQLQFWFSNIPQNWKSLYFSASLIKFLQILLSISQIFLQLLQISLQL